MYKTKKMNERIVGFFKTPELKKKKKDRCFITKIVKYPYSLSKIGKILFNDPNIICSRIKRSRSKLSIKL